jgi:TPR repeat protein
VRTTTALCLAITFAAGTMAADGTDIFEKEIRVTNVSAAGDASNIHLAKVAPARFAAWDAAANTGNAAAQWLAGRCYVNGYGVTADQTKGASLVRKAADQGYARAQMTLGQLYAKGRGVTKDPVEAAKWYQKAVDQGLAECYEWLALAYRNGAGVPKDPAKAKELYAQALVALEKAADDGIAGCQMRMGRVYTMGQMGVKPDIEKGLKYYRMGLAQNHVWCQANMGDAYQHGRFGLPKDPTEAVRLYRLAAAQGDTIAQASLVAMYLDKEVPNPNPAEADQLFRAALPGLRKAAEGNEPEDAAYALARMYETGSGVEKDDASAVKYLVKAADHGSKEACAMLADRYETGRGVPKDLAAAAKLREKAKPKKAG